MLTAIPIQVLTNEPNKPITEISTTTQAILVKLRVCESGNKDEAINLVDKDKTSSFGRYQFKPQTLYGWAIKYGILTDIEPAEIMNVIMDGELQERVLTEAIKENGKNKEWFLSQFPECSRINKFWNY